MTGTKKSTVLTTYLLSFFSIVPYLFLAGAEKPVALFVFGDSVFDPGNNNYINTTLKANFWPYGETFFGYSTGRTTNGRTIPDFISEYANLPFIRPYLEPGFKDYIHGVNFASKGAGVLLETHKGYMIDLKTQVTYFNNVKKILRKDLGGEEEAKVFFSSAVYLISIGSNDYFDAFDKNPTLFQSQHSLEEYVGTVIGNLTNVIQEIYNKGGRKFGIMNLSPLGCLPRLRGAREKEGKQGCVEELIEAPKLHNKVFYNILQNLAQDRLDGFKYSILDVFTSLRERLDNPSKYGFKEAEMACCGSGPYRGDKGCGSVLKNYELCEDPSEFLIFDSVHPTEKTYKQLAELFWTGNSNMTWPYSLKLLIETDTQSFGFQAE